MSKQTVSISPHIRGSRTTKSIMMDVIIAMLPVVLASAFLFGVRALLLTALSSLFCVLLEGGWQTMMKKPVTVDDYSAVVTGMLVAMNVPVDTPIWMLFVGDVAAIILVKQLFGGLGCNFVNPALVARLVMMFSFPTAMTTFTGSKGLVDATTSATPMADAAGLGWNQFMDLFLGKHGGAIGETCGLALLIGGIYLIIRKVIKPIIPLCMIGSCCLFTFLFGGGNPLLQIFTGGLLLGAIFMATDYVTSPITNKGKVIFGIFIGFLTAVIRVFGSYPEGVTFAILFGNVLVPYINDLTMTKPLGGIFPKKAKKEEAAS